MSDYISLVVAINQRALLYIILKVMSWIPDNKAALIWYFKRWYQIVDFEGKRYAYVVSVKRL